MSENGKLHLFYPPVLFERVVEFWKGAHNVIVHRQELIPLEGEKEEE